MDHAGFQDWLDRYVEAWRSNDADTIGALFTEDARYSSGPFRDDDAVGRDAVVKSWLTDPDDPADWEAHYEPFVVEGDRGVAVGWSRYYEAGKPHGAPEQEYGNVFLVEFAQDGRCRDFRDSFMETPSGVKQRSEQKVAEAVEAARIAWQSGDTVATEARELSETRVQG